MKNFNTKNEIQPLFNKYKRIIVFLIFNLSSLILILLLSLIFYTCSNPTEEKKVTFSGTVTLEDTTDFSGVQISRETEFDHTLNV